MTGESAARDGAARDASTAARAGFGAAKIAVAIVLGLLAAWFLFDGVSNLLALPQQLAALGLAERTPWVVLWSSAVLPLLIFASAIVIGRRLSVAHFTLVLIVALCVIATSRLSLIAAAGLAIQLA
jgi:hypothetical protein